MSNKPEPPESQISWVADSYRYIISEAVGRESLLAVSNSALSSCCTEIDIVVPFQLESPRSKLRNKASVRGARSPETSMGQNPELD